MPAPKDPVVEFARWAQTATTEEYALALKLIIAMRKDAPVLPRRRRARKTTDTPAAEPAE